MMSIGASQEVNAAYALLDRISDPEKFKRDLENYAKVEAEAKVAAAMATKAKAEAQAALDSLANERAKIEQSRVAFDAERNSRLEAEQEKLERARASLERDRENLTSERKIFEDVRAAFNSRMAQINNLMGDR